MCPESDTESESSKIASIAPCVGPPHTRPVTALAISRDSVWVACGYDDGRIMLWTARNPSVSTVRVTPSGPVRALAFSPGAADLASAHDEGCIMLWQVRSSGSSGGRSVEEREKEEEVELCPEADLPVAAYGKPIRAIDWAPDGKLAACSDTSIFIWKRALPSGMRLFEELQPFECKPPLTFVAFSPNSRLLAYGGGDDSFSVRNIKYRVNQVYLCASTVASTKDTLLHSAQFDAESKRLVTCSSDGTVRKWDVSSPGTPVYEHTVTQLKNEAPVKLLHASFAPDGALTAAASGAGGEVLFNEWEPGAASSASSPWYALAAPDGVVIERARFSQDGRYLATGSASGAVCVWQTHPAIPTPLERIQELWDAVPRRDPRSDAWYDNWTGKWQPQPSNEHQTTA